MSLLIAQAVADTDKDALLMWGFILGAAAVVLLFLELLIPSGGLIGLLCGVAAVASVVAFFRFDPTFGVGALLLYVIMAPVLIWLLFRVWIHSPLARRMILGGATETEDGEAAPDAATASRRQRLVQLRELIGAEGIAETALRPVGFVKINGRRLDGLAESGVIEAGTPVVVTDVYDNQIQVRVRT